MPALHSSVDDVQSDLETSIHAAVKPPPYFQHFTGFCTNEHTEQLSNIHIYNELKLNIYIYTVYIIRMQYECTCVIHIVYCVYSIQV